MVLRKTVQLMLLMLIVGSFLPASEPGQATGTQLDRLKARVQNYWNSRRDGKLEECYALLTRSSRERIPITRFIKLSNVVVIEVVRIDTNADPANSDQAVAKITYKGNALGQLFDNIQNRQEWKFEEGDWFLEYRIPTPFDINTPLPPNIAGPSKAGEEKK